MEMTGLALCAIRSLDDVSRVRRVDELVHVGAELVVLAKLLELGRIQVRVDRLLVHRLDVSANKQLHGDGGVEGRVARLNLRPQISRSVSSTAIVARKFDVANEIDSIEHVSDEIHDVRFNVPSTSILFLRRFSASSVVFEKRHSESRVDLKFQDGELNCREIKSYLPLRTRRHRDQAKAP